MTSNDIKIEELSNVIKKHDASEESLMPVLHEVQRIFGTITEEAQMVVSKELKIPLSKVHSVVTFFSKFNDEPKSENVISVCDNSVCRVNGSAELVELLEDALEIKMGEITHDGKFALKYTPCFGACDISPAIRINDDVYGDLSKDKIQEIINSYREGK